MTSGVFRDGVTLEYDSVLTFSGRRHTHKFPGVTMSMHLVTALGPLCKISSSLEWASLIPDWGRLVVRGHLVEPRWHLALRP